MTAPRKIWLQWNGDAEPDVVDPDLEDVTWCVERIYNGDVEYIRADLVEPVPAVQCPDCSDECLHPGGVDAKHCPWCADAGKCAAVINGACEICGRLVVCNKMKQLIGRARELAALAANATPGPWSESSIFWLLRFAQKNDGPWHDDDVGGEGAYIPEESDAKLIAAVPEMIVLLSEMSKTLYAHRRALAVIAQELDGWGDVDLFERAFQIACERDPDYANGAHDPTPDDYAQALLDAVLVEDVSNV